MDTQVLIVGGGPIGLTLAIDLAQRGVRCTLVEHKDAPAFLPKMERCNARTMEIYRRMGIVERVRAAGLPAHCPMDVFVVISMIEPPLVHHPHPSVAEARRASPGATTARCRSSPISSSRNTRSSRCSSRSPKRCRRSSVRYGHEFLSFKQDPDGVTATVRSTGGAVSDIRSQYLVGCDGGTSTVRKQLGIELQGEQLLQLCQALYRCDELYDRIPIGKGRPTTTWRTSARRI